MKIIRNSLQSNRFNIDGVQDTKAIAGFHGGFCGVIGWIAAKIFRKAVRIEVNKKVYYLNCNSLENWRKRMAPEVAAAKNMQDPNAVKMMIEQVIHTENETRQNVALRLSGMQKCREGEFEAGIKDLKSAGFNEAEVTTLFLDIAKQHYESDQLKESVSTLLSLGYYNKEYVVHAKALCLKIGIKHFEREELDDAVEAFSYSSSDEKQSYYGKIAE